MSDHKDIRMSDNDDLDDDLVDKLLNHARSKHFKPIANEVSSLKEQISKLTVKIEELSKKQHCSCCDVIGPGSRMNTPEETHNDWWDGLSKEDQDKYSQEFLAFFENNFDKK